MEELLRRLNDLDIDTGDYSEYECYPEYYINAVLCNFDIIISSKEVNDIDDLFDAAEELGYARLNCGEILTTNNGQIILKLAEDKYLKTYRDSHFFITNSLHSDRSILGDSVDFLSYTNVVKAGSKQHAILLYISCVALASSVPEFCKLLKSKPEVVDRFINLTMRNICFTTSNITINDVLSNVTLLDKIPDEHCEKCFGLISNNENICNLYIFSDRFVIAETMAAGNIRRVKVELNWSMDTSYHSSIFKVVCESCMAFAGVAITPSKYIAMEGCTEVRKSLIESIPVSKNRELYKHIPWM